MTHRTHRLRTAARQIAKTIGIAKNYHVAWVVTIPAGSAIGSMTVTMRPWLHIDNYHDLVEHILGEQKSEARPTITSITKL